MSNDNTLKTSDNDSTKSSGSTGFDILRDLLEKPSPLIVFIICNIIFNIDTFILVFGSNNVFKKVDMLRLKYDILVVEWYYKIFFSFLIAFIHPICQRLLRYFIKRCLVLIDKRLKYDLSNTIEENIKLLKDIKIKDKTINNNDNTIKDLNNIINHQGKTIEYRDENIVKVQSDYKFYNKAYNLYNQKYKIIAKFILNKLYEKEDIKEIYDAFEEYSLNLNICDQDNLKILNEIKFTYTVLINNDELAKISYSDVANCYDLHHYITKDINPETSPLIINFRNNSLYNKKEDNDEFLNKIFGECNKKEDNDKFLNKIFGEFISDKIGIFSNAQFYEALCNKLEPEPKPNNDNFNSEYDSIYKLFFHCAKYSKINWIQWKFLQYYLKYLYENENLNQARYDQYIDFLMR